VSGRYDLLAKDRPHAVEMRALPVKQPTEAVQPDRRLADRRISNHSCSKSWPSSTIRVSNSQASGTVSALRRRFVEGGFLRYRYRGTDPGHRDNVGLRLAKQRQTPPIYLHGIVPGLYEPTWPVFIVEDQLDALTFIVAIDDQIAAPVAWQV
jgi:hypothetical protein